MALECSLHDLIRTDCDETTQSAIKVPKAKPTFEFCLKVVDKLRMCFANSKFTEYQIGYFV